MAYDENWVIPIHDTPEERAREAREDAKAAKEARKASRRARLDRERRERDQLNAVELDGEVQAERDRLERSIGANLAEQAEENQEGALRNATRCLEASMLATPANGVWTKEQRDARRKAEGEALASFRRAAEWSEFRGSLSVIGSRSAYGPGSPDSWYLDYATANAPAYGARAKVRDAAVERLLINNDIERRERPERVDSFLRDLARMDDSFRSESDREYQELRREWTRAESRAMSSAGGSGGVFLSPWYPLADWAVYRGFPAVFLQQATTKRGIGTYGLTVNVARVTGPAGSGVQTEGSGVTETDPTTTFGTGTLETIAGQVTASQALVDRTGPGYEFDLFVTAQLNEQVEQQLDVIAIDAAIAGASVNLARASYTNGGLLSDVGQMSASLQNAAGTALPPSAIVAPATIGEFLLSQTGSDGRPVFMPHPGPGTREEGYSGYALSGIPLWFDMNIPANGSDARLIVANKTATFQYQGELRVRAFPETLAPNLRVLFVGDVYATAVSRYPAGAATASGAAYPTAPTWA